MDVERHQQLLATLDARGGTQRGKPRSHDPTQNPLGGRIFDMACSLADVPDALRQDVPLQVRLLPSVPRGRMLAQHGRRPHRHPVHAELPPATDAFPHALAEDGTAVPRVGRPSDGEIGSGAQILADLRAELAQLQLQLKTVSGNMALAKTPEQFEAISAMFDQLKAQEASLQTRIADAESKTEQAPDAEAEVAGAMGVVHRLTDLCHRLQRLGLGGGGVPADQRPAVPTVSAGAGREAAAEQGGRGRGRVRRRPGPDRNLPRPDRASGPELQRLDRPGRRRDGQALLVGKVIPETPSGGRPPAKPGSQASSTSTSLRPRRYMEIQARRATRLVADGRGGKYHRNQCLQAALRRTEGGLPIRDNSLDVTVP